MHDSCSANIPDCVHETTKFTFYHSTPDSSFGIITTFIHSVHPHCVQNSFAPIYTDYKKCKTKGLSHKNNNAKSHTIHRPCRVCPYMYNVAAI